MLWIRVQDASGGFIQSTVRTHFKNPSFSTRIPGGFNECSLIYPCDRVTAFDWYDTHLNYRITVMEADQTVWDGRVEDLEINDEGLKITARGYWANTFDVPHNANYASSTAQAVIKAALTASCTQISSDQSQIGDSGIAVTMNYVDNMYPGNIIEDLGKLGDAGGTPWVAAIWDDKVPYFTQRGTAVTWQANLRDANGGAVPLTRSLKEIWNEVSIIYQYGGNRVLSGSVVGTASQTAYGRRVKWLTGGSAVAAVAEGIRDTYLNVHKDSPQQANIQLTGRIRGAATGNQNVAMPLWRVRAGDRIRLKDLVPVATTATDTMDGLRIFHILETRYDYDSDTLTITPDNPSPTIDVLLAQSNAPFAEKVKDMSSYFTRET